MRRWIAFVLIVSILTTICADAVAAAVRLPKALVKIEDSVFYEDDALDEVFLPYGAELIDELAFAYSGIRRISIPSTVSFIAKNAFEGLQGVTIVAPVGSVAQEYALEDAQVSRDFVWEDAGDFYSIDILRDLIDLEWNEEEFAIRTDDIKIEYMSTAGITDPSLLEATREVNAAQQKLEERLVAYEGREYELLQASIGLAGELEGSEASSTGTQMTVSGNLMDVSMSGDALDLLNTEVEVISTEILPDGRVQSEVSSCGTTFYITTDGKQCVVSRNASAETVNAFVRANLGKPIARAPVEPTAFETVLGWMNNILSWYEMVEDAADASSLTLEAIYNSAKEAYEAEIRRSQEAGEAIRDSIASNWSRAQKNLTQIRRLCKYLRAFSPFAMVRDMWEDANRYNLLQEINEHGHPLSYEQGDSVKLARIEQMKEDIKTAAIIYQADFWLTAGDLVGYVASLLGLVQLCIPGGQVTGALTGVAGIIAFFGSGLGKGLLLCFRVTQIANGIRADVYYDRAIKTDSLLHQKDDEIVGNTVYFGRYEQDNNLTNGKERIQWRILIRDGNYALLLSEYGLDAKAYHSPGGKITWENCTLRAWLNGEFMSAAFSASEQEAMRTILVDNSRDQGWAALPDDFFSELYSLTATGGNNTYDKVFLLSLAEAFKYLGGKKDVSGYDEDGTPYYCWKLVNSMTTATDYAKMRGACTSNDAGNGNCVWWLRSPGSEEGEGGAYEFFYDFGQAIDIEYDGSPMDMFVTYNKNCVRPAIWVNLNSEVF